MCAMNVQRSTFKLKYKISKSLCLSVKALKTWVLIHKIYSSKGSFKFIRNIKKFSSQMTATLNETAKF